MDASWHTACCVHGRRASSRGKSLKSRESAKLSGGKKMAIYRWQGVSPRGETISGEMEAATRDAVLARLRAQRIQPIPAKIRERGKGLDREIAIPGFGE